MPLFFSKKARTVDGFLKVLGFVFFIFLGYVLRRTHILKEDTVHALSGLLLYVTLPCLILRSLNGLTFELSYLWLIALGLLTNIFMVVIGYFLGKGDPQKKFFCMLNLWALISAHLPCLFCKASFHRWASCRFVYSTSATPSCAREQPTPLLPAPVKAGL